MTNTVDIPLQKKSRQQARVIEGLRRLSAGQRHGQTFSDHQIAAACGVTPRAIVFIGRGAMAKFVRRLHAAAPTLCAELLQDRPIREVFDRFSPDAYKATGRPMLRPKGPEKRKQSAYAVPMCEVTEEIARRSTGLKPFRNNSRKATVRRSVGLDAASVGFGHGECAIRRRESHEAEAIVAQSGGLVRVTA